MGILPVRQISRRCSNSLHYMGYIFPCKPWKQLNLADLCRLRLKKLCTVLGGICSWLFEARINKERLRLRASLMRSTHSTGVRGFPADFSGDNLHVALSLLFQNRILLHDGASRPHWSMNRLRTTVKVFMPANHTTLAYLLLQLDHCYWACPKLRKDITWSTCGLRAFFVTVQTGSAYKEYFSRNEILFSDTSHPNTLHFTSEYWGGTVFSPVTFRIMTVT